MTQSSPAETRLPAKALRIGAVLAASGPVILKTSRVSAAELNIGICWGADPVAPVLMTTSPWWQLLSWGELLLPVVLAGLLLCAPRRTTLLGSAAVCAVLGFRLFVISLPFDTRPLIDRPLPVDEPWLSIVCYTVAIVTLLVAARSPLPPPPVRKGIVLWAAAIMAAAWTVGRLSLPTGESTSFGWFASTPPTELLWKRPGAWACKADVDGVLIVLIALAAAAGGVMAGRTQHRVAWGIGALLILAAVEGFVTVLVVGGGEYLAYATKMIRWHLLVAAALVIATTFRDRPPATELDEPHPL
ncbi:hypothetical protein SMD20_30750 [Nonomuraea sp. LP-02]|uniref:hypothetical protein n=1 Tax=Nonomuraea sp. LP-02 TaxID=3097960 RepID=UPI002E2F7CB4|nr:hypothetical protein [Nonomuraea sp. LP-02]MED7928667.1 hypothetical protein [Nonomuraea sp. LP-02]